MVTGQKLPVLTPQLGLGVWPSLVTVISAGKTGHLYMALHIRPPGGGRERGSRGMKRREGESDTQKERERDE